jgi:hypothetical protein
MVKNIAAISFIYLCVCASWMILGNVVLNRTYGEDQSLTKNVESLWGPPQTQEPPDVGPLTLSASDIDVQLNLQQRKKGLIWYPTYRVKFAAAYDVSNPSDVSKDAAWKLKLPAYNAFYDNLKVSVAGKPINGIVPAGGIIEAPLVMPAHSSQTVKVSYDSQGMNDWRYGTNGAMSQAKNFTMRMTTDFDGIDFPQGTRSPTSKIKQQKGWQLQWHYDNTFSGCAVGMAMPRVLNPGPWVSQVTFFAPVSLFFFFFVTWLITTIKSIRIHPMHYFFIGAAFFSFHLLIAYSVDQIPVEYAFAIASVVSMLLVLTYISRAVPDKRFFVQIGIAQFIYLIFFSFTFFLEQFTGLIITYLSIFTLFLSMQYTARFDWSTVFRKKVAIEADAMALLE